MYVYIYVCVCALGVNPLVYVLGTKMDFSFRNPLFV